MDGFIKFLSDILGGVFDRVLAPILISFLKFVVNQLIEIIVDAFSWLFYLVFTTILKFLDVETRMFEIFAGTTKGHVNGGDTTVLEYVLGLEGVRKYFLIFTLVGVGLSIIFSIIATIKSISDMTLDDKNPISKVLSNGLKSLVSFAVVPVLCLFLANVSTIVIDTIDTAALKATNNSAKSIDRVIWLNCSLNASKRDDKNYNSTSISEEQRQAIAEGRDGYRVSYVDGTKDYEYSKVKDSNDFKEKFDYKKFDYAQGIVTGSILVVVFGASIAVFIGRIFEIVLLYIVGPIFCASIANDGGEMFKSWKDMFVAKFIGSYSVVLGMRLFTVMAPIICSGAIQFSSTNIEGFNQGSFNSFIQLIFLVGGAYAVFKAQTMILRIISIEAATSAEQTGGGGMGVIMFAKGMLESGGTAIAMGAYNSFTNKKDDGKGNGKPAPEPKEEKKTSDNGYRDGHPE